MNTKKILVFVAMIMTTVTTFAQTKGTSDVGSANDGSSVKMVCNLQATSSTYPSEYLTNSMFFTSDSKVEIFGAKKEVAIGYERYGAIISNTSKGMLVVLFEGEKPLYTKLITTGATDFTITAPIDNLKFDKLELECGGALVRTN
ncbi:MAG: hypothetical protein H7256_10245 [Bdellovibrio sp.]|nr:hypothetical protein [Bdellovibrio sp.]